MMAMVRVMVPVTAVVLSVAVGVSAQGALSSSSVADIDVNIRDGNSYVIFYDGAGSACVTSGAIVIYKKVIRFRDEVKMKGRGINQQFVRERVPYEDYGVAVEKNFSADDFKEIVTARGKKIVVLPLALPGTSRGESVRVVFGRIEKTITAGY